MQTLLSNNATVNARSKPNMGTDEERTFKAGRTPLHWGAAEGHESVVRILLEHNADMNIQNATGRSALQDAIYKCRDDVALLLIAKGASLTNKDSREWTPLHEASFLGRFQVVQALVAKAEATNQLSAILDATTNGEDRGWYMSVTPLFLAILRNRFQCIRCLLDCGASTTQKWGGDAPLHAACLMGNLEIVQEILDRKNADIEVRDPSSSATPLLKAASTGKTDVIRYLWERGADVRATDNQGRNALERAKQHPQAVNFTRAWIF